MSYVADLRKARTLHQQGKVAEALAAYLDLLPKKPESDELLFLIGAAELQIAQFDTGIAHLEKSLKINPKQPLAYSNLAMGLHTVGRYADALVALDKALELDPNHPGAHFNKANTLQALGQLDKALLSYARAIELAPSFAPAHNNSGIVLQLQGRFDSAYKCFTAAIAKSPHFAEAYNNRGNLLRTLEKREQALEDFNAAISIRTDFAEAYYNRGNVLLDLRRFGEGLASLTRALELRPKYPEALNSRAVALQALGRTPEAIPFLDKSVALSPSYVEAYNDRGIMRLELGDVDGAIADYQSALKYREDYPQASWNLALATLLTGDYQKGWDLFEYRWSGSQMRFHKRDYKQPLWQGEDISGKTILLYAEQGNGDTVQFSRFVPMVAARGAKVLLEVQPGLKSLMATMPGDYQIFGKGEALPDFDYQCPLMSLPRAFHIDADSIPGETPYITADPEKVAAWAKRLGKAGNKRVGLVISGSKGLTADLTRSIPAKDFAPLLKMPLELHLLQKEIRESDQPLLKYFPNVITHTDDFADFSDTAALIENLDLVISVDTAVAHVAAAMGKQVFLLTPVTPDWRWQLNRSDSPWYPSVRIFRQQAYRDWAPVMAGVCAALGE